MKTSVPSTLITIALVCFAVAQNTQAISPPPDGDYPGGNTAEGQDALLSLTTGTFNTGTGYLSLKSNTTGNFNTAIGAGTLLSNTGDQNTAIGAAALLSNTTGLDNTATGEATLFFNTTGSFNTANGASALQSNTTGSQNTATGVRALLNNTIGNDNTANGNSALQINTTGSFNTANGKEALLNNTTGLDNTATGDQALLNNTSGSDNTGNGGSALRFNTTGINNTATGALALFNNTTGSSNIALGLSAGANLTTGSNNIDIGNVGVAGESATIRIGSGNQTSTFIAGINGTAVTGTGVVVNASGQLGVATSSARFKYEIKSMDKASEALFALKPVTFRYKKELDPEGVPQFGLVAEEVAKADPDLIVRDKNGEIYTVRYDAVNAMLLNEFLREHRKVQEHEAIIAQVESNAAKQEATIARQQKQIEALTTGLQKVSAQLAAASPSGGGPGPQVVNND